MNEFSIITDDPRAAYQPGEEIKGRVAWRVAERPEWVELRLGWVTSGEGTPDAEVVASDSFEAPGEADERSFSFQAPIGPHSFTGKLITLTWTLELFCDGFEEVCERIEIIISPTGEIRRLLPPVPRETETEEPEAEDLSASDAGPDRP